MTYVLIETNIKGSKPNCTVSSVCVCVALSRLLVSWVNAGTKQCVDCPLVLYMHLRMAVNSVLQIDRTHTHTHIDYIYV